MTGETAAVASTIVVYLPVGSGLSVGIRSMQLGKSVRFRSESMFAFVGMRGIPHLWNAGTGKREN